MCNLTLIRAVVIHRPDFLMPGAVANEIDLRFGDSLNPATEAENDFVGELVRHKPRRGVTGGIRVLLAKNLRGLSILDIKQPALHSQLAASDTKIAKRQHRC